jgi:hypothetical protein
VSPREERTPDQVTDDERGGVGPYLMVVLVAVIVAAALAVYVAAYRQEIVSILTQSPT